MQNKYAYMFLYFFSWKPMNCFVWMNLNNWIDVHDSFCCCFGNSSVSTHSCHNHITLAGSVLLLRPSKAIFVEISFSRINLLENYEPYGALLYTVAAIWFLWFLDLSASSSMVLFWLSLETNVPQPLWSILADEEVPVLDWYLCQ